ncbi:MAG: type II toxin-antitoxin system RelE/ParE family toxin [Alkalinema sp. RU_4_3]|nr:type II toxin-antitoxin system RelE/ParE family toxin [Alkalinema sp. RU_4_3]
MSRVLIRSEALLDLDDIFDYIADDSLDRAIAFIQKLHDQIEKIAATPGMGRRRDELLPDLRCMAYGNYMIFYFSMNDGIDVVRVINGARDIEAIFQK